MNRTTSAVLGFVGGVAFTLIGYWIAGFDFDERGKDALGAYLLSMMNGGFASVIAILFPRKEDSE